LAAFAHAGLGMLISVVSSSTRTVVLWSQLILLPSMMMGVMIPLSDLPAAFGKAALLLPATHAMNVFNGLAQNQTTAIAPIWSVLILLIGGLLSFGLANYLFSWDSHNKTRRGHPALALLALSPYILCIILL
ncbi:MAG: ABC transporter permease, partial [Bacteroidales bacterium]|nr:ABC transporter permease [Bacteroidales bacterium]